MSALYDYDFVICIEATAKNKVYADSLKDTLKKLFQVFRENYIDDYCTAGHEIKNLRVKFIFFRDFSCCEIPIEQTEFCSILDGESEAAVDFDEAISTIIESHVLDEKFTGGYGYCNVYEALALAIRSDWSNENANGYRHVVFMFSNGKARPLGGYQSLLSKYPENMPKNTEELVNMWNRGVDYSSFRPSSARMLGFVPYFNDDPWCHFWSSRFVPANDLGAETSDIDIDCAMVIFSSDW